MSVFELTNVQESLEVFGIRHYPKSPDDSGTSKNCCYQHPPMGVVYKCFLGLLKKMAPKLPSIWHPERMAQVCICFVPRFSRLLCLDTTFCKAKVTAWVLFKTNRTFQTGADWRCICELLLPQIYANLAVFFEFLKWRCLPMFNILISIYIIWSCQVQYKTIQEIQRGSFPNSKLDPQLNRKNQIELSFSISKFPRLSPQWQLVGSESREMRKSLTRSCWVNLILI